MARKIRRAQSRPQIDLNQATLQLQKSLDTLGKLPFSDNVFEEIRTLATGTRKIVEDLTVAQELQKRLFKKLLAKALSVPELEIEHWEQAILKEIQ